MTVNGIDLSHYNTMPDMSTVDFVIHKATQGVDMVDGMYAQRIGQVRALGKIPGSYHFMSAFDAPMTQVGWYLAHAQPQPGDILALDFERDSTWTGFTDKQCAAMATSIMNLLAHFMPHNRVLLYCNVDTYYTVVAPFGVPVNDGLWIAAPNGEPLFPHVMRQYASSNVDYDMTYFDGVDEMRRWAANIAPPIDRKAQQQLLMED